MLLRNYLKKIFLILFLFTPLLQSVLVHAQTADLPAQAGELQNKIDDRNSQIKQLEAEISQYNIEVTNAQGQAKTLQNTLKTLDLTKKKITTDLTLTAKKIDKTTLTIQQLGNQIETNKKALISGIQNLNYLDDTNIVATVLSDRSIGDLWNEIDSINQMQISVRDKSEQLTVLQSNMQNQKKTLLNLKQDLSGKKQAVESTVQEKATVLAQTKNKEQAFQAIVQTKEQQKTQFEKEVFDFESQLHLLIDKGSYPSPRNGILSWPLDDVFVTQKFGKTVGAEKLYTSGSHNGVDFRASIGTRVKNVLDGVVVGTGNTDIYPGCYSFGKWVMVKHGNGLSTIYGHLSVIAVTTGKTLNTGDVIGYSGNTGYSTGPHLHISVYATQGVRIEQFVNSRGCKQAIIPLADIKAYLDPLLYLPSV
jgi:murein DD-endopeptidase MepM/ murein hydrolase activator NlpD